MYIYNIFYSAGPHCFYFLFILSNPVIHSLSFSLSLVHLSVLSSSTLSTSPPSSSSDPRRRSASDALLFRRSTSGQLSLSSSCDALGLVFDLGITSSSASLPIHFGFLIWIHFMWMSLFFIFDCCYGLLAW